jgi:hypothetical protein
LYAGITTASCGSGWEGTDKEGDDHPWMSVLVPELWGGGVTGIAGVPVELIDDSFVSILSRIGVPSRDRASLSMVSCDPVDTLFIVKSMKSIQLLICGNQGLICFILFNINIVQSNGAMHIINIFLSSIIYFLNRQRGKRTKLTGILIKKNVQ